MQAAYLIPNGDRGIGVGSLLAAAGLWPRYVISMDPLPRTIRASAIYVSGLPEGRHPE